MLGTRCTPYYFSAGVDFFFYSFWRFWRHSPRRAKSGGVGDKYVCTMEPNEPAACCTVQAVLGMDTKMGWVLVVQANGNDETTVRIGRGQ